MTPPMPGSHQPCSGLGACVTLHPWSLLLPDPKTSHPRISSSTVVAPIGANTRMNSSRRKASKRHDTTHWATSTTLSGPAPHRALQRKTLGQIPLAHVACNAAREVCTSRTPQLAWWLKGGDGQDPDCYAAPLAPSTPSGCYSQSGPRKDSGMGAS